MLTGNDSNFSSSNHQPPFLCSFSPSCLGQVSLDGSKKRIGETGPSLECNECLRRPTTQDGFFPMLHDDKFKRKNLQQKYAQHNDAKQSVAPESRWSSFQRQLHFSCGEKSSAIHPCLWERFLWLQTLRDESSINAQSVVVENLQRDHWQRRCQLDGASHTKVKSPRILHKPNDCPVLQPRELSNLSKAQKWALDQRSVSVSSEPQASEQTLVH